MRPAHRSVVIVEGSGTVAEETLRAGGHQAQVLAGRLTLQELLEADLRKLVEDATGRKVWTFLSAARVDPDVSAEVFLLESEPGEGGEPAPDLATRVAEAAEAA